MPDGLTSPVRARAGVPVWGMSEMAGTTVRLRGKRPALSSPRSVRGVRSARRQGRARSARTQYGTAHSVILNGKCERTPQQVVPPYHAAVCHATMFRYVNRGHAARVRGPHRPCSRELHRLGVRTRSMGERRGRWVVREARQAPGRGPRMCWTASRRCRHRRHLDTGRVAEPLTAAAPLLGRPGAPPMAGSYFLVQQMT